MVLDWPLVATGDLALGSFTSGLKRPPHGALLPRGPPVKAHPPGPLAKLLAKRVFDHAQQLAAACNVGVTVHL